MDDAQDTAQDRVTIQKAAERLGVKEDAIRKRIQRGTLRHEKTQEGRVFVWVDAALDATQDTAQDAYRVVSHDALLSAKDETIAALREQLVQANERDRENRRTIADLTSSLEEANQENRRVILALTSRIPAIEALSDEREAPETVEEAPDRAEEPRHATGESQEGVQRPWWRRVLRR